MAKTSAERQAAYRAKRAGQNSEERRLNTWVSAKAYLSLEELAKRYGVTRRAVIELLVSHEEGKLEKLRAEGKLLVNASTERKIAALARNESGRAAEAAIKFKKPAIRKLLRNETGKAGGSKESSRNVRAAELRRNTDPESGSKKTRKQSAMTANERSALLLGEQVGFEF